MTLKLKVMAYTVLAMYSCSGREFQKIFTKAVEHLWVVTIVATVAVQSTKILSLNACKDDYIMTL